MQATGECLTIGTGFELAFMKAVRSVNKSHTPRLEQFENITDDELKNIMSLADDRRIFAVYEALYRDFNIDELNEITNIDKWFLFKLKNVAETQKAVENDDSFEVYQYAKNMGFTDFAIEKIRGEKP